MVGTAAVFLGRTSLSGYFYGTSCKNRFCGTVSNYPTDTGLDRIPGTVCCIYMGADSRCVIGDQISIGVSELIQQA